jgi:mannose-6-phosphate isomerase-like protein (cupin superfamily)
MPESKPFVVDASDVDAFDVPHHEGATARELVNPERGSEEIVFRLTSMDGNDHWHMHEGSEQFLFVRGGEGTIRLGEPDDPDTQTVHELSPETFAYIPRRTHHQVTCTGSDPLELLIVWSPPYESLEEWDPEENQGAS